MVVKLPDFFYLCIIMEKQWKNMAQAEVDAHGVCDEYSRLVKRAQTKDAMIALYKRGINWSLENNAPSIGLLRDNRSDCERNGVFIDREFHDEVLINDTVYVFHHCRGTIRVGLNVEKRIIPMLYFANGCDMTVKGITVSAMQVKVPLYIFGDNIVVCEQSDDLLSVTHKYAVK